MLLSKTVSDLQTAAHASVFLQFLGSEIAQTRLEKNLRLYFVISVQKAFSITVSQRNSKCCRLTLTRQGSDLERCGRDRGLQKHSILPSSFEIHTNVENKGEVARVLKLRKRRLGGKISNIRLGTGES